MWDAREISARVARGYGNATNELRTAGTLNQRHLIVISRNEECEIRSPQVSSA
jgi:hypothetical protein